MCEAKDTWIPGPGDAVSTVAAGLAGFIGRNAIPFVIAAGADICAGFLLAHPFLVIICSVVLLVAFTAGRVVLSRVLLRVLGRHVVPVGYEKLRKPATAPAARVEPRTAIPAAAPQPALAPRAPLAIEPPRTFVAGEVTDTSAVVMINGVPFPVLDGSRS